VETYLRPLGRRKALKGEAQERGELKEASRDEVSQRHREGSQTPRMGLRSGQGNATSTRLERDVKKRVISSANAEGSGKLKRGAFSVASGRPRTRQEKAAHEGERR
jgi:hypothetical protein